MIIEQDVYMRVLYHVTPTANVPSITVHGINPQYHTGKLCASWYVDKNAITWAIAHVSLRKHVLVEDISVICAEVPLMNVRRSGMKGVFYCIHVMWPENVSPAEHHLYLPSDRERLPNERKRHDRD